MRIIALDIHRVFAEAVMLHEGQISRLGRVGMRRDHLIAFARKLQRDDHVVIEATGNAHAVADAIRPHVGRLVIANPRQVRLIAEARIHHRRECAGQTLRKWVPARGLDSTRTHTKLAKTGDAAQSNCTTTGAAEDDRPIVSARSPRATLSACRFVRSKGTIVADWAGTSGGRARCRTASPARIRPLE